MVLTNQDAPAAGVKVPFTMESVVTGLTLGTPIWADLEVATSVGADLASVSGVAVTIMEVT